MHFRKPTYFVAAIGVVASWSAQQWASGEPWFNDIPFATVFELSTAFLVGLLVQDLYNPNSWIRDNIRRYSDCFDAGPFLTTGYHNGRSLQLQLIAKRSFRNCEIRAVFLARERTTTFPRGSVVEQWSGAATGDSICLPILSVAPAPDPNHEPREQVYWGVAGVVAWGSENHRARKNQPSAIFRISITAKRRIFRQNLTLYAICRNYDAARALITIWDANNNILYADG